MRRVRVGETTLFECASCGSDWLDPDTFSQLCLNREERGSIAAMVGRRDAALSPPRSDVRYVACAICQKTMNRENFGKRSGVIIDICKGHGVWFEPGELQAVMSFIDTGGLERARKLDAQRIEEEKRTKQRMLDQAGDASVVVHRDSSSVFVFRNTESRASRDSVATDSLLADALKLLFG
jgi:Zn-finger nucleic acid-binding protein